MKKNVILFFSFSCMFLQSCDKMEMEVNKTIEQNTTPIEEIILGDVIYEGDFVDREAKVSGKAQITENDKGERRLVMVDFNSVLNLDLQIILSKDEAGSDYVLINDRVENGNIHYKLPDSADLETQKYIIIWCKSADVNFGLALLSKIEGA